MRKKDCPIAMSDAAFEALLAAKNAAARIAGEKIEDADGWELIDSLEAMDCLLSPCWGTLDDVPG